MYSLTSVATIALAALSVAGVDAGLSNTRSRVHSQHLAARRVQPVGVSDTVANGSQLQIRDAFVAEAEPKKIKKRCSGHKKGGKKSGHKSSSAAPHKATATHKASSTPKATKTSSASKATSTPQSNENGLTYVGVPSSSFDGDNTGGIASWFQADSGRDSTDGTSWCNLKYTDDMPLFAPKFSVMSPSQATWGSDPSQWEADASKWCGLEAEVTYNGNTQKLYIGDAFDDAWVRTENSIDVLVGGWAKLSGYTSNNKDDVLMNVSWKLTGYKNPDYEFKS